MPTDHASEPIKLPRREWYWAEPSGEFSPVCTWKSDREKVALRAPVAPGNRIDPAKHAAYREAIETFLGILELDHSYMDLPAPPEGLRVAWNPADALDSSSACDCGWSGVPGDDCPDCGDPFWIKAEPSQRVALGVRRTWSAIGNRWKL